MPSTDRYSPSDSYQWNYDHPPETGAVEIPAWPAPATFCGLPVGSHLGVAAGPLLNGRWLLHYAALGFDVLTYKTVRSAARECYPLPNLVPVRCGSLFGGEADLPRAEDMTGSWAVSFGMPSQPPDVWRRDVEWTRGRLASGKRLVVSVVGTVQPGWSLDDLAADYARCARWAADAGAEAVEANFSCPNVATRDGQLYQQPADAARVAAALRESLAALPLVIKVGHVNDRDAAVSLVAALAPHVDGLSMTNSVAATVVDASGQRMFDGQPRGICGAATREASLAQTRMFADLLAPLPRPLELIGVGGVSTAEHVAEYLAAGATSVQLATAIMIDPQVAVRIRQAWPVERA